MTNWMDNLLRETLDNRASATSAACLDAETAAAFADDTLASRERSRAEAHVAECARCQAMLAAIARTTPPAAPRSWWRRPVIAWLAPIAVVATAILVWVNVPPPRSPEPPVQIAREEARPAEADSQPSVAAAPPAQVKSQAGVRHDDRRAPAAKRPGAEVENRARVEAPAAQVPPPLAEETMTLTAETGARPSALALESARDVAGASSDANDRWRIGTAGVVYHSADGGSTWKTHATGVDVTLSAASSPSPSVCWFVGPGGTVVVSIDDGGTWQRVPFPVAIDLVSVRATSANTATVVTADGRAFSTSDQGRTWTR